MSAPYQLLTTPTFERDFQRLGREVQSRIKNKLNWLAHHPDTPLPLLRNMPDDLAGLRKYRVGDYRILLWADHSNLVIKLYSVGHRSTAYRNL